MKKKNIIAWSVVVGVFLTICIVCAMVFTLSKVEFQLTTYITQTNRSRLFAEASTQASVENDIYENANFEFGNNLLFMNFDKQIANIEKANPYIKIEKIVRKFPNKIIVYYSEREAVALLPVQNVTNAYYVVDTELKVLDYVTYNGTTFVNQGGSEYVLPVVDYFSQSFSSELGQVIDNTSLKSQLATFVSGAFSANGIQNALYEDIMCETTSIKFYQDNDTYNNKCQYIAKSNTNANVIFEVWSIEDRLFDKISYSWNIFIQNYKETQLTSNLTLKVYEYNGKITVVDTTNNQEIQANE